MRYRVSAHRHGLDVIQSKESLKSLWQELSTSIFSISDDDIKQEFIRNPREAKSISQAINILLDKRLTTFGWNRQSCIFKDEDYKSSKTWTLDFSKATSDALGVVTGMAVEVAFNHGEAIAWNLIKPNLAAEQNHVSKETDIGEGVGVYICATKDLKEAGGFDNAVGEYEKVIKYLKPLTNLIPTPLIILGLEAPDSFRIEHFSRPSQPKKKIGRIVEL